jgi:[ribosomal protein S5]-alanine N-acetyltransferase
MVALPRSLTLQTRRLRLVAGSLEHINAELQDPASLGAILGVAIPASWPPGEYDRDALDFFHGRLTAGGPAQVGWYVWYALTSDSQGHCDALVAAGGYFGPPSQGSVEIGFSVIPEARARGYATEIAQALIARAFDQPGVQVVNARTADSNVPSTRVLLKCGFHRVGPGAEPGTAEYQIARI